MNFCRSDVCSLRYECKHASFLHIFGRHARMHALRSAEIGMSIHWTFLRNFNFNPKILHCLKAISNNKNVHIYTHWEPMNAHITPKFVLVHP